MASTTTQTSIANRALQILGYKPIGSLTDNDRGARAINRAYQSVLLAELQSNYWNFSIRRASLPASTVTPSFGPANYYPVPWDFIMLAPPDQYTNYSYGFSANIPNTPNTPNLNTAYTDWQIENVSGVGNCIASNDPSPLYIRYISSDLKEAQFDPLFAEAFAAALAMETCEELTQSNSKLQNASKLYDDTMELAKKRNCFQNKPVQPPVDPWILVRM